MKKSSIAQIILMSVVATSMIACSKSKSKKKIAPAVAEAAQPDNGDVSQQEKTDAEIIVELKKERAHISADLQDMSEGLAMAKNREEVAYQEFKEVAMRYEEAIDSSDNFQGTTAFQKMSVERQEKVDALYKSRDELKAVQASFDQIKGHANSVDQRIEFHQLRIDIPKNEALLADMKVKNVSEVGVSRISSTIEEQKERMAAIDPSKEVEGESVN